jgi:hypothetical protein
MKIRTLVLAGLSSFLLTSLVYMPISFLQTVFPQTFARAGQGFSGTLWSGSAQQLHTIPVPLQNVAWTWSGISLFKGQLAADVKAQLPTGGKIQGLCGVKWNTHVVCRDLTLSDFSIAMLATIVKNPMLSGVQGKLQANLSQVIWDRQSYPLIEGSADWHNAGLPMLAPNLGTYSALLTREGDEQHITLNAKPEAALEINGQVKLQADASYQFNLNLKPNNTGSDTANLQSMLTMVFGKPNTNGQFHVEQQGKLPNFR